MQLKYVLAAAGLLTTAFFAVGAGAQTTSCVEDDLKCRVAALEARLDAMTGKVEAAQIAANQAAAAISTPFYVHRFCKVSCTEEAVAECKTRGFAQGKAEDWERPKSGPVTLTRIMCKN